MQQPTRLLPPRPLFAEALVWTGVVACVAGMSTSGLWRQLPLDRFGEILLLAGVSALLAWPLQRWRGWSWASSLGLAWLFALVAFTGLLPALAVALLVAAAIGIGGLIMGDTRCLPALLSGMAVVSAAIGWTISLPLHYWWTYGPLLALVVVLRRDALRTHAVTCIAAWRSTVQASPRTAAWSVLVLGMASAGAWLPTMQYDDVAYHLALPWQLMLHGRYALDPSHQVWALAPWAGDVLHAVPQVIARAEARSALNIVWFMATAAGLWQLGALLRLRPAMRWAAPALFASLPLTVSLLGSMQTETAAGAITVGLAVLVMDERAGGGRRLLAGALLFGLLAALKPMHLVAALPLLAWAGWRHRRALPSPAALFGALLLAILVGGPSYAQAWMVAGNPVLPLFNSVFLSPWFGAYDFVDPTWQQGLGFETPWRMTFDTDAYMEGWDGGMGVLLVALSGAWLVALSQRASRGLAAVATLGLVMLLLPMQYARYLHPTLLLLLPALASALQWLSPPRAAILLAGVCITNVAMQPFAHWMLRNGGIRANVMLAGADMPLFVTFAPERAMAAIIRERAPDSGPVLLLSQPFQAEFAGRGRNITWYSPRLFADGGVADLDASGKGWEALLRREGIAEAIVHPGRITPAQRAGLARVDAWRALEVGGLEWWRIPAAGPAP